MVVVLDERLDLAFEVAGWEVVLQQHAVLRCLVPALDLALGLGMEGRAARMAHAQRPDPLCQFAGDIAGSVVRQQARFVSDVGPGRSLMLPVPVPGCR